MANIIGNTMSANASNFYHHHFHTNTNTQYTKVSVPCCFFPFIALTLWILSCLWYICVCCFMRNEKLVRARQLQQELATHHDPKTQKRRILLQGIYFSFRCASLSICASKIYLLLAFFQDATTTTHTKKEEFSSRLSWNKWWNTKLARNSFLSSFFGWWFCAHLKKDLKKETK